MPADDTKKERGALDLTELSPGLFSLFGLLSL